MILPAHDFRGHVPRGTRGVIRVIRAPQPGNAHICDPHVALVIEEEVFGFDVSVNDAIIVHVF